MSPNDGGVPPAGSAGRAPDDADRQSSARPERSPAEEAAARSREEEAEARLRDIGSFTDSMAAFAGPDDEGGSARVSRRRRRDRRRDERGEERAYAYSYDEHAYQEGGASALRWAVRVLVPLAFLGVVVALVLVVMSSGILSRDAAVSPSPSPSRSGPAVVGERAYKIKKNDTLSQIAERFGTTVDKILEANPKLNINNLRVGTKLTIPAPE